jgi:polyhydroxybutyrate depolymerase
VRVKKSSLFAHGFSPSWSREGRATKPALTGCMGFLMKLPLFVSLFACCAGLALADVKTPPVGDLILSWQIDGVMRDGMFHVPPTALTQPVPIIFAWHGHGGSMKNAANSYGYHKLWPEAISVYLQGLNTPGRLTDPEGKKPGWQGRVGDQGDRDLKLFDAVLAQLKRDYKIDERRLYSTGHSNGGGFTYLLWSARGDLFAAMAPSSSASFRNKDLQLMPKPVLHVAGETDPLVKYAWQKATMDSLRELNQSTEGHPWGDSKFCTEYDSKSGNPVITCIHPGNHSFLKEAPALIVKFFKQHALPEKPAVKP